MPLTQDEALAIPDLAVALTPAPENGCTMPCWAVSHLVAATSKRRVQVTPSHITTAQLDAIRRQVAMAIGVER